MLQRPPSKFLLAYYLAYCMIESTSVTEPSYPIFYSFRRCPYAMRARLALAVAEIDVEIREIELRNKPPEMLAVSPKGTVPVLVLVNGRVIDQSLDIMLWALTQQDPQAWLAGDALAHAQPLIEWNDGEFKHYLDRYKYADQYPEYSRIDYRRQGELFLAELERRLNRSRHLSGERIGLADAAILPFIRQFAAVDNLWFQNAPYPALRQALDNFLTSELFNAVMRKYQPWKTNDPVLLFGKQALTRHPI